MFRRLIRRFISPNPTLGVFAALLSCLAAYQTIYLIRNRVNQANFADMTTAEAASSLGLFLILVIVARSFLGDLLSVFGSEKRIICGTGQAGTAYHYKKLLSRKPKEVIIAVQNLATLLSDGHFLPCVSLWLSRMRKRRLQASLTVILSTPDALAAIDPTGRARDDLMSSVKTLREYLRQEPEANEHIQIRFHPGTSSLSAFICDPTSRRQGILVFTPKWAIDVEPANRLYCVVERWEHQVLFDRIAGTIPAMTQSGSQSLAEISSELGVT